MKSDFPLSGARIKALKSDLSKLTDVEFLKKELARIADEIKGFHMRLSLSPQAKRRLRSLEKRFHRLKANLAALQKHVDSEVNKFASILRRSAKDAGAAVRAAGLTAKTAAAKASSKKSARKSAAKASKAGRRTSSKKTSRRGSKG